MNNTFLPVDELIGIAVPILNEAFGESMIARADIELVEGSSDPDGDVWIFQLFHPPGTPIDHQASFDARGRLAAAFMHAGDKRLILLRHRFRVDRDQAA